MRHISRSLPALFLLAVTATVLAGCSTGGAGTPTATRTVTATPEPSSTAAGGSTGSAGSTSTPSASPTAGTASGVTRCTTSSLAGTIERGSGGAAGSVWVHIALRNTGTAPCTLQGWPGVSFVGGGNGSQIGAAADRDESSPHPTVTLATGQTAVAPLKVTQAGNYPSAECAPTQPDGFRVYPPGSTASLFIRDSDQTACADDGASLLVVQALVPEGQATT